MRYWKRRLPSFRKGYSGTLLQHLAAVLSTNPTTQSIETLSITVDQGKTATTTSLHSEAIS